MSGPGLDAFDGMPVEGVWTFTLTTTPNYAGGDGLHGWDLTITRAGADVPPCDTADVDRDGVVDVGDLVAVILAWGPCTPLEPCAADVDGNGQVDVDDMIMVILNWS